MSVICNKDGTEVSAFFKVQIPFNILYPPIEIITYPNKRIFQHDLVQKFLDKYCIFMLNNYSQKNCKLVNRLIEISVEGDYINVVNKSDRRKIKVFIADNSEDNVDCQLSTIITFIGTNVINNYPDWEVVEEVKDDGSYYVNIINKNLESFINCFKKNLDNYDHIIKIISIQNFKTSSLELKYRCESLSIGDTKYIEFDVFINREQFMVWVRDFIGKV